MGKPSAPTPPSPQETSQAQTGSNLATTIANTITGNMNQHGPGGSLVYNQTGQHEFTDPFTNQTYQIPTFEATTTLSPGQQAIFDQNQATALNMAQTGNQLAQSLGAHLGQGFDPGQLPGFGTVPQGAKLQGGINRGQPVVRNYSTDFSADRRRVERALLDRMQPSLDQDRERMDATLANQGIGLGSRAFSAAQQDFGRNVNDARMSAILAGGQEQSRMVGMERDRAMFQNAAQQQVFGQRLANRQLGNAARQGNFNNRLQQFSAQNALQQQALQQALIKRNQPINEITALLSGSQVSLPNFTPNQPQPMPFTDNAGLINQHFGQLMQNYNAQMGAWNQTMGGLLGFGGSLLSDERAKTDIRRVGKTDAGLPIYTYRYRDGGPVQMGVLAQEAARMQPEAVVDMGGGLLGVDYRRVK